ncbi:retinoid-inducible serine carboxypeptidase-like [Nasonia vitripennis]|uniref:Uncharacterized protein n=1 Tax=Nasonia vitripennis TaxID=7425 RepID=A0A7M7QM55_NASVI|nr:retinoid-inducible serine carboxypeptidase-like [Nasonia vitripennis]
MGEFVYQMGLLDTHTFNHLKTVYEKFEVAVETENWSRSLDLALIAHQIILDGSININVYNVLDKKPPLHNATNISKLNNSEFNYLMNHQVKKALGLNSTFKPINFQVRHVLRDDFMKAVTDQIEYLLNVTNVKVYVYSGQLDAMCPTSGAVKWLDSLNWENSTKWYSSAKTPLVVNDVLEGYVKQHGNLKMFWINRAGHMAPAENPNAVLAVLEDLTDAYNNTTH